MPKPFRGALSELEQWNLSDIQNIYIIWSPGSVTYTPGAVAGVINTHTKHASDYESTHLQDRDISNYNFEGVSLNYGFKKKTFDLNFQTNLAMTYLVSTNSKVTFNTFNLFNSKYNKRYSYDSGTCKTSPINFTF